MQEYIKTTNGDKRVVRFESYCARKEVIDRIIEFAEGYGEDGKRRSVMVYKVNYDKVKPVSIFEEKTETLIDYYPLTVVWRERYYIGGKEDDAWKLFRDYEV